MADAAAETARSRHRLNAQNVRLQVQRLLLRLLPAVLALLRPTLRQEAFASGTFAPLPGTRFMTPPPAAHSLKDEVSFLTECLIAYIGGN